MSNFKPRGLGWCRDIPDPRDYTPHHEEITKRLEGLKPLEDLPSCVDWRDYLPGVEDQESLDASAAHACVALIQFFERRASGAMIEPSRLFVHRTAGHLVDRNGKGGVNLRTTWKAVTRFGIPSETYWPYDPTTVARELDAFAYSSARSYNSVRYVRLDGRGRRGKATLKMVKAFLAGGFPSVFGFSVSTALSGDSDIPFPTIFDGIRGGQAAVAVGYDDDRRIRSDRGALLLRNSWGSDWGEAGYGWLPYAYVQEYLAVDFWTLVNQEWLASGEFNLPIEPAVVA